MAVPRDRYQYFILWCVYAIIIVLETSKVIKKILKYLKTRSDLVEKIHTANTNNIITSVWRTLYYHENDWHYYYYFVLLLLCIYTNTEVSINISPFQTVWLTMMQRLPRLLRLWSLFCGICSLQSGQSLCCYSAAASSSARPRNTPCYRSRKFDSMRVLWRWWI